MTRKDIENVKSLEAEIKIIKENLEGLREQTIAPVNYSGMPRGCGISDPTSQLAAKREELELRLYDKLNKLLDLKIEIERFLDGIDDPQARTMLRLRMTGKSWLEIAFKVGQTNESAARMKCDRYLEKSLEESDMLKTATSRRIEAGK